MSGKRSQSKGNTPSTTPGAGGAGSPLVSALIMTSALGFGVWNLVERGRMSWPPVQLLSSLFTVAGGLALVAPLVLLRKGQGGTSPADGLGEQIWLAGGLLIWVFDLAALARGEARGLSWATPLGYQAMGLTILAVLLAGWRGRGVNWSWRWTNLTGWILGLFWIGMGLATLVPTRGWGVALQDASQAATRLR